MNKFAGFPKIDPEVAALCNALTGRQWHFESQLPVFGSDADAVPCSLAFAFHALETLPERLIGISAETGFGSFDIFLEPDLVARISDLCLPGWDQELAAAVRSDWLALYALSQVSAAIGLHGDVDAAWAEQGLMQLTPRDMAGAVCGTVHVDGAGYAFVIRTWAVQTETVAALIGLAADSRASLADPGFTLQVQPVPRPVALRDFWLLSPGDILLLASEERGIPVQAWLGQDRYWDGMLDFDGAAVIQGEGKRGNAMQDEDYFPSDVREFDAEADGFIDEDENAWLDVGTGPLEMESGGMGPPLSGFPLGELPVRLDFKLASKTVTLEDFSRLGGGAVLELAFDLNSALSIEANGTRVGTGQLVQVGDSVGLQILKWHPRSAASDE